MIIAETVLLVLDQFFPIVFESILCLQHYNLLINSESPILCRNLYNLHIFCCFYCDICGCMASGDKRKDARGDSSILQINAQVCGYPYLAFHEHFMQHTQKTGRLEDYICFHKYTEKLRKLILVFGTTMLLFLFISFDSSRDCCTNNTLYTRSYVLFRF